VIKPVPDFLEILRIFAEHEVDFIRLRQNTLQLVGAQRRSRQIGAAGRFTMIIGRRDAMV